MGKNPNRGRGRGRGGGSAGPSEPVSGDGKSQNRGGFSGRGNNKPKGRGGPKGITVNAGDEEINKQLTDMGRFLNRRKEMTRTKNDTDTLNNNFRQAFAKIMAAAVETNVVPRHTTVRTVLASAGSKSELGVYRVMTTYTLDPVLTDKVKKGDTYALESVGKVRTGQLYSELKADRSVLPNLVGMKYVDAKNRLQGRPTLLSDYVSTFEDLKSPQAIEAIAKFCEKNRKHLTLSELGAYYNYMVTYGEVTEQFKTYEDAAKNQNRHAEFLAEVDRQIQGGLLQGDVSFHHGTDFDSSFVTEHYDGMDSTELPYNIYMSNVVAGGTYDVPAATRDFKDVGAGIIFKNGLLFTRIGNHYYVAFPASGPFMYISEQAVEYWFAGEMKPMSDAFERIAQVCVNFHLMHKIRTHYLMSMSQDSPAIAFPINKNFDVVVDSWSPRQKYDEITLFFEGVTEGVPHGFKLTDEVAKKLGYEKGNIKDGTFVNPYPKDFYGM